MTGRELGIKGENLAAKWLVENGYRILHRNWRWKRNEIDLIAVHRSCIVFVEVKSRSGIKFGHPEQAVGPAKERHLANAASAFLSGLRREAEHRFDIIAIVFFKTEIQLTHFRDAFYPGY